MGNRRSRQSPPPPAPPMPEPWRRIGKKGQEATWDEKMEEALRDKCLQADLKLLGQRQVRILVLGATGSGKSSLINSLYCALTSEVDQYTYSAASDKTVTQFLYHPSLPIEGSTYFRIQDAPGIMEKDEDFYTDFVTFALQGHLKEDVQIPPGRISTSADYYVKTPGVMDRPCLVVFVLGSLPLIQDSVLKGKLDIAKELASQNKIKLVIVLTKADLLSQEEERPLKNADAKYTFHSKAAQAAVEQAHRDTGIPTNRIFPVTNYTEQMETCTEMNIVLLYTLSKLLSAAKLEARNRLEAERAAGPKSPD